MENVITHTNNWSSLLGISATTYVVELVFELCLHRNLEEHTDACRGLAPLTLERNRKKDHTLYFANRWLPRALYFY